MRWAAARVTRRSVSVKLVTPGAGWARDQSNTVRTVSTPERAIRANSASCWAGGASVPARFHIAP